MLGEQIGETRGKRVVRRVLSSDPVNVEVTFEDSGKLAGVDVNGFGTYTSELRPDGTFFGEGQGAYMSATGDVVTWKGSGLGRMREKGGIAYRGAIYYRTSSQKLARLNNVVAVFEYEVDANGETSAKLWEWR